MRAAYSSAGGFASRAAAREAAVAAKASINFYGGSLLLAGETGASYVAGANR
jgi:hypothetical protein